MNLYYGFAAQVKAHQRYGDSEKNATIKGIFLLVEQLVSLPHLGIPSYYFAIKNELKN